jgi:hypothetical protein
MYMTMQSLLAVSAATMFVSGLAASRHAVPALPCPVPGLESAITISTLKEMLSATAPSAVALRSKVGLSGVDSASILVVADSTVCTAVTHVIDSATHSSPSTESYLVLRAGPRYVAFPHRQDQQSLYFVDTNFVFKSVIP